MKRQDSMKKDTPLIRRLRRLGFPGKPNGLRALVKNWERGQRFKRHPTLK